MRSIHTNRIFNSCMLADALAFSIPVSAHHETAKQFAPKSRMDSEARAFCVDEHGSSILQRKVGELKQTDIAGAQAASAHQRIGERH